MNWRHSHSIKMRRYKAYDKKYCSFQLNRFIASKTSDEFVIRLPTIKAHSLAKIRFFSPGKFMPRNLGQSSRFRSITDKLSRTFVSVNVTSRRGTAMSRPKSVVLAEEIWHNVTGTDLYACDHSPMRVRRALVKREYADRNGWLRVSVCPS